MPTIDDTLAERGKRYGEFDSHAYLTQAIKGAMRESEGWDELDPDMIECLEMVAHKIGRIINGDPSYVDSWTDIIGYCRLVEKRLIGEQAQCSDPFKNLADAARTGMCALAKATQDSESAKLKAGVGAICEEFSKVAKAMAEESETKAAAIAELRTGVDAGGPTEHKLITDALDVLAKAGVIKEKRTHGDRFHVIFVGEESGEI